MAMFQGILPPNAQPEQATLPPGLLALLPQGGATAAMGRNLAATQPFGPGAGQPYAPGQQPLPSSVPGASNNAPPVAPRPAAAPMSAPLIGGPPMLNPMDAAMAAASEGAAKAQVYDSPLATLASSLLAGIASGASAFKVQKQVNAEAKYTEAVQRQIQDQSDAYVNNDANFGGGGLDPRYQAILRSMPVKERNEFLLKHDLVPQPKISTFGENNSGMYDANSGKIIREAKNTIGEGEAVEMHNADGTTSWVVPNPKPVATNFEDLSPDARLYALRVAGPEVKQKGLSQEEAKTVSQLLEQRAIRAATAGRPLAEDSLVSAFNQKTVSGLIDEAEAMRPQVASLGTLYEVQRRLAAGEGYFGRGSGVADLVQKGLHAKNAAEREIILNEIGAAAMPNLKPTFGGQLSDSERIEFFTKWGANGDLSRQGIQVLVGNQVKRIEDLTVDHRRRVNALIRRKPALGDALLEQVGVDLPSREASPPATPPTAPASPLDFATWKKQQGGQP